MKISIEAAKFADYRDGTIEELNELIDEIAAVAWDRDCSDITIMPARDPDDGRDLRFTNQQSYYDDYGRFHDSGRWEVYTGNRGNLIAYWDTFTRSWKAAQR